MPLQDDASIPDEALLLRVLRLDWAIEKSGRRRPASYAFIDSNWETSLFINALGILEELRRLFPGLEVASVPSRVLRENGFAVARRPAECPEDFRGDSNNHVVIGPSKDVTRNEYERNARAVAKHPDTHILPSAD